ncbi:hypothetical protein U9M48_044383 [Paspalum notatum var. saurae]|uniref:Uncharacterized protein n=1 Tax=Paspalum notatum var. saurae TaxID=547442 RepID=A0AAQ3XI73_PASNO
MHHGGSFSKEDALSYDGGEVCLFRNIEKDVMSYFHVVQLAKSVGFKDGDTLFYGIPGRSLEATIDQLIDDASVSEMMKYADQTNFLEIYIKYNEHYGSNYPTDADPSQPDTITEQLRMDRRCFWNLCSLVKDIGGLRDTRNVSVEEMVAMFLHVLAYDEKSRSMRADYQRSQETISRYFNNVLGAILKLWRVLLKTPQPISNNCALDGTYIKVRVPAVDKPRYRSRKNDVAINVLGACTPDMQFIYVLAGWEGSAVMPLASQKPYTQLYIS